MTSKSKYLGLRFEGRWEVTDTICDGHHTIYVLTNIYNNNVLRIRDWSMKDLAEGKTTVSKIIKWKINKENTYEQNW